MTESEFWSLIDEARLRAGTLKSIPDWLEANLAERSPAEIIDFGAWLAHFMARAHNAQLWNAGSIINGGLSDDGFVYFKCWLISQGKAVYESALSDPDSLAALEYPDHQPERGILGRPCVELEKLMHTYVFAYNRKCGNPPHTEVKPPAGWEPPVGCQPFISTKVKHQHLLGPKDELEHLARFPRLMQRFAAR